MTSLTPQSRNREATEVAMHEGLIAGAMTLAPSAAAVYLALQNSKTFVARTNVQSRTAIAIMPALFVSAWTAEKTLINKMDQIAHESEHNGQTVQWAEKALEKKSQAEKTAAAQQQLKSMDEKTQELTAMYRKSVEESGVCIVPGDRLGFHHRAANYASANPVKLLASLALPSVAWIYYGNNAKQNLNFSIKILHTRVFGQFATISLLLGVMGFKDFMDNNGKFITETEADARVQEMHRVRQELQDRLEAEKQHQLEQEQEIAKAHEQDVRDHNTHTRKKHHRHHKKSHDDNNKFKHHINSDDAVALSH